VKRAVIAFCGIVMLTYVAAGQQAKPGPSIWTAGELKGVEKTLAQKLNAQKSASQALADAGTHTIQVSYREASGEAEVHEQVSDVFVVQAGEATLTLGGTMVSGKTTAPGEIRGTSIEGGQSRDLGPGDVVNIPPGVPHRLVLKAGKAFTYLVVKVHAK